VIKATKFWRDAVPISRIRRPKYKSLLRKCVEVSRISTSASRFIEARLLKPGILVFAQLVREVSQAKGNGISTAVDADLLFGGVLGVVVVLMK